MLPSHVRGATWYGTLVRMAVLGAYRAAGN
jgi:hypothetical protein